MNTGETPYPRDSWHAVMFAHLNDPVPIPSDKVRGLPAAFDQMSLHDLVEVFAAPSRTG